MGWAVSDGGLGGERDRSGDKRVSKLSLGEGQNRADSHGHYRPVHFPPGLLPIPKPSAPR